MKLKLIDTNTEIEVSEETFGREYNENLVHQVKVSFEERRRQGTKGTKNRAKVKGSTRKLHAQKGTGRARIGDGKAPHYRSGGRAFPGHNRDFDPKVNKKMYRGAMKSILSELVRQERLSVVETFQLEDHKTKNLLTKLEGLELNDVLIITETGGVDENLYLAARNLKDVAVCDVKSSDPLSLISFKKVLLTKQATNELQECLAS